jgi:hypothetical protein
LLAGTTTRAFLKTTTLVQASASGAETQSSGIPARRQANVTAPVQMTGETFITARDDMPKPTTIKSRLDAGLCPGCGKFPKPQKFYACLHCRVRKANRQKLEREAIRVLRANGYSVAG